MEKSRSSSSVEYKFNNSFLNEDDSSIEKHVLSEKSKSSVIFNRNQSINHINQLIVIGQKCKQILILKSLYGVLRICIMNVNYANCLSVGLDGDIIVENVESSLIRLVCKTCLSYKSRVEGYGAELVSICYECKEGKEKKIRAIIGIN